ncbi:MAG: EutN/CcmL family microcompartment protein [Pseudomonadota bacterium]
MFVGRVVGSVWATVKWPQVHGVKLLTVQPYHLSDFSVREDGVVDAQSPSCHDLVVCADILGAGVGEDVVIAYGHAARVALHEHLSTDEKPTFPIDAAVVAIVDRLDVKEQEK